MVSGSVWCGQRCPCETRVFKTRLSRFIFFLLPLCILLPRVRFLLCSLTLQYVLRHCKSAHPDHASSFVLQRCKSTRPDRAKFFGPPHRASSDLFFLCWFFLCSSSNRSRFGLLQNRVLETRFYFLELKPLRLEIYMAILTQISK